MLNDISTNIRELTKNKIVVISSIIICITCLIIYNSFHKSLCKEEINKSENQLINKVIDKNHKDYYNYNGDGLQNLIDDTSYDFYVRANCGSTDSDWSVKQTFKNSTVKVIVQSIIQVFRKCSQ